MSGRAQSGGDARHAEATDLQRVQRLCAFDRSVALAASDGRLSSHPILDPHIEEESSNAPTFRESPIPQLLGFDEAGRGALAGPVVVACLSLPEALWMDGSVASQETASVFRYLNDSKRVSPTRRERLYEALLDTAAWGIGCASACEIDRLGIVSACTCAAGRAYRQLNSKQGVGLFDRGLALPPEAERTLRVTVQLTRGDARSCHIAAASILAKVWRDRLMVRLEDRAPGYALAQHKGYGTADHRAAILQYGLSRFHRRSFATMP